MEDDSLTQGTLASELVRELGLLKIHSLWTLSGHKDIAQLRRLMDTPTFREMLRRGSPLKPVEIDMGRIIMPNLTPTLPSTSNNPELYKTKHEMVEPILEILRALPDMRRKPVSSLGSVGRPYMRPRSSLELLKPEIITVTPDIIDLTKEEPPKRKSPEPDSDKEVTEEETVSHKKFRPEQSVAASA